MKIEAATLAGGKVNQDYYAYGDTYALVLDGASSFLAEQTSIDASIYVKALGEALSSRLEYGRLDAIPNIVAESIKEVAEEYGLNEECSPSSTVIVAKWDRSEIVTYVLGDSSCVLVDINGNTTRITDNQLSQFGADIRREYRRRLESGHGFDDKHKILLKKLQSIQKKYRNSPAGYWIAGADPAAAFYGIVSKQSRRRIKRLFLATDGGMDVLKAKGYRPSLYKAMNDYYLYEKNDFLGKDKPRSKLHDDKTIILIENNLN